MANYYCKWCGACFSNVRTLTFGPCERSPIKKHELYEGGEKSQYTCKYCGVVLPNLRILTFGPCTKSPTKRHHPAL